MGMTTIQTTDEQAQYLKSMGESSKKAALQKLIDSYEGVITHDDMTRERVREIIHSEVRLEALE